MHREVHVDAAAALLEPDLRAPETDAGAVAGHDPDRLAIGPAVDDGQSEHARVERFGGLEVDHLEDELANSGDRNAHAPDSAESVAMVDGWKISRAAERARLAPHFSNVDGPVFALVDLPETVKGAMFARYSRYPGTLRRLFLDEFADSLPQRAARRRRRRGRPRGGALRAHLRRLWR